MASSWFQNLQKHLSNVDLHQCQSSNTHHWDEVDEEVYASIESSKVKTSERWNMGNKNTPFKAPFLIGFNLLRLFMLQKTATVANTQIAGRDCIAKEIRRCVAISNFQALPKN